MHSSPYHFSFETFKLLQSLIHHSTLAFTNSMLREELEKMVVTDHLTKLYSRSYLDDRIHQSMNEDHEGTFMLVDIDDFKLVNDTYGHQVGDEIIIQVANLINSNIRSTDIGARWGGEELALYLPGVSLSAGVLIAERIVRKVCQITDPQVTISCGISYWSRGKKDSYAALFKRADRALYTAKNTGKNKVIIESAADSFI
jgi:diguanylate cyclase (GGDEF)-like protein